MVEVDAGIVTAVVVVVDVEMDVIAGFGAVDVEMGVIGEFGAVVVAAAGLHSGWLEYHLEQGFLHQACKTHLEDHHLQPAYSEVAVSLVS